MKTSNMHCTGKTWGKTRHLTTLNSTKLFDCNIISATISMIVYFFFVLQTHYISLSEKRPVNSMVNLSQKDKHTLPITASMFVYARKMGSSTVGPANHPKKRTNAVDGHTNWKKLSFMLGLRKAVDATVLNMNATKKQCKQYTTSYFKNSCGCR